MFEASPAGTSLLPCSSINWAKFQRTKGDIKLHLIVDHDGYLLPSCAVITPGNVVEVKVAQGLRFDPSTILIDDRGYNDYGFLESGPLRESTSLPE